jgi:c(7)-type cytochrome triheme protein
MYLRKVMLHFLILATLWILPDASMHATERGKTIVYRGGGQGRVVFDGHVHSAKGYTCRDCHTDYAKTGRQLFETQRKGLISTIDHENRTKCFVCHNGLTAFYKCEGCHR